MLENITTVELFNYILLVSAVIGVVYTFIVWIKDPKKKAEQQEEDRKQDIELALARQEAEFLKEKIQNIEGDIHDIKNNHLAHIEPDILVMKRDIKSIYDILNNRLPK